jgi:hypothetical protein
MLTLEYCMGEIPISNLYLEICCLPWGFLQFLQMYAAVDPGILHSRVL